MKWLWLQSPDQKRTPTGFWEPNFAGTQAEEVTNAFGDGTIG